MRKQLYFLLFGILVILLISNRNSISNAFAKNDAETTNEARVKYEKILANHPYNRRLTDEQMTKIPKADRPDLAFEQDFLATMDPNTGKPEVERLYPILAMTKNLQQSAARTPGSTTTPWVERGPNNVGGRTRALAWDPVSVNKIWAGGVSGGLWYNSNITSSTSSWVSVNDFWDNIAVTAIVFDPNNNNNIYVATGESYARANRGAGIWKSTNGGTSFTQLTSTSSFYYINDMVIRNESDTSVIYAAVAGNYYRGVWHGTANEGLQRSTNGGTSWTQVLPNVSGSPEKPTDIDIAADNKLWVGVDANSYGDGGGKVYSSANGTSFSLKYSHTNKGRVNLACAPSNSNYVYALFEYNSELDAVKMTSNGGTSWTSKSEPNDADNGIPSTDFTRGQAFYDLTIDVDPLNMNTLIVGGIDLFKSTNGATSWSQISHWYGGFTFQNVHADQHAIVYRNGSSSRVVFGNDGGVAYSSNANTSSPTIAHRNKDYNVTQFYACAIHPTSGSNYFLAGAQDNGTQQYSTAGMNATTEATGGDGAYTHIDQTNGNYQTTAYVYNSFYHSSNGGLSFSSINSDQNTGRFINPSDLDDNQNILYTYQSLTSLYRVTGFQSSNPVVSTLNITSLLSSASCLKVSPYTTSSSKLFVGTTGGRLYRIANANATPTKTEITGSSFPTGSISSIEFGQTEQQIIVTFSNYGVTSIWYTSNGGTSWASKEGNLPDMPVRWALFNPLNYNEVIVATEVGVWSTSTFATATPTWTASNSGLANVRVDMLQTRTSDNAVIAATHGRGLFSSTFTAGSSPTYCAATSTSNPCDEYISNVTIGTINNSTTCGNYSNFTSQIANVTKGTTVAMSISTGIVGGTNVGYTDDQVAVWIDWNNDYDFLDAGENVYLTTYSSTSTFPLSINVVVPTGATAGNVRMRVRMSYFTVDGQITPCGNSAWGEVEDYTINVLDPVVINWTSQPGVRNIECSSSTDPTNTGTPSANSTCTTGTVAITYTDNTVAGSCANAATITRTWLATDGCGVSISYDQTINVSDNTAPTINCPVDQKLISTNGTDAAIPDYTAMATVTDNCSATANITLSQFPTLGTIKGLGITPITITATDECGNVTNCQFDVEIKNTTSVSEISVANITLFPNPTRANVEIHLGELKDKVTSILVYNILGELVTSLKPLNGKEIQVLNIQNAAPGMLFIKISVGNQVVTKRVMKL
tara:strand:- start:317 stop:3940 length:3624 start_codon:yes stop_codon:yes gene_type:complete